MSVEMTFQFDKILYLDLPAPVCVDKDAGIVSVIQKMKIAHASCILVCEEKRLLGVFTTRDVLNKTIGAKVDLQTPIKDLMTASPASLSAEASIAEAIKAMNISGVRHLPLINDDGEVAGLISADHIVRYLVEHFPTEVYNLPPRLKQMITSAEGA